MFLRAPGSEAHLLPGESKLALQYGLVNSFFVNSNRAQAGGLLSNEWLWIDGELPPIARKGLFGKKSPGNEDGGGDAGGVGQIHYPTHPPRKARA